MAREEEMARPERFKLPTTWFEEVTVEIQPNRNSKLDGPPSLKLPQETAEHRLITLVCYVSARIACFDSTIRSCQLDRKK